MLDKALSQRGESLLNIYLAANILNHRLKLGQTDGKDTVFHTGRNLALVYIVGQKQALAVLGVAELTTQILAVFCGFLVVLLLHIDLKIAFIVDLHSAVLFLQPRSGHLYGVAAVVFPYIGGRCGVGLTAHGSAGTHKIIEQFGQPITVSHHFILLYYIYDILDIGVIDKRKPRGTGEEVLSKLDNPVAKAIQSYRGVQKLVDTYIDKLPDCINPNDGRIHASFNQYGTVTGRFSSDNPNLQNIPSHGESKEIRKMFIASPGYVLMSSDYSQQEPKCLAALCKRHGDPQMYNTFMQGKDLYSEIASKAFNKPYEDCLEFNPDGSTNEEGKARRTQAKSILLGVLYGRGVPSIAEQLHCTTEKAQTIKDSVFRGFPAIKQFEQDSMDMAYDLGYVTTISGRKRRLPDLQLDEYEFQWQNGVAPDSDVLDFDSEEEQEIPQRTIRKYLTQLHKARFNEKRKIFEKANEEGIWIIDNGAKIAEASRQVVNSRIQGSAADLTKLAMIELNKNERLKELGFRLLIQIHDEVIVECPEENAKECSKILADTMSKAAEGLLKMPIKCDVTMTREWYGNDLNGDEVKIKESQTSHAMDGELRNEY